jgi:ferritin-like metal-binding protein YciE
MSARRRNRLIDSVRTLVAWTNRLDMPQAVKLLQQTLDEEKKTDEALTELAEAAINTEAQEAA